jgi:hypothetical protein
VAVLVSRKDSRISPQATDKDMMEPRGALDVVVATVGAGNIVGMGPTAPTQAALPVAHARMLGRKHPEKKVYTAVAQLTCWILGCKGCP